MRGVRRSTIVLFAVWAAACGGGGSGTPPSPVPNVVTITAPSGVLFLGDSHTFTMSVSMSNGSVVTTGGTWGSDAPTVATVSATSGVVQIVGIGDATIYVDYQGARGTRRIATTVRYAGRLNGVSRATRCTATGDWLKGKACDEFPTGFEGTFSGNFTQTERDVTALMSLGDGDSSNPVAAQVDTGGHLRFETLHTDERLSGRVQWRLQPVGTTQIGGTHVMRFTFVGLSGYLEVNADIIPTVISRNVTTSGGSARSHSFLETLRRHIATRGEPPS